MTDADVAADWLIVLERRLSLIGGWHSGSSPWRWWESYSRGNEPIAGHELGRITGPIWARTTRDWRPARRGDGSIGMLIVADSNFSSLQRTQPLTLRWRQ